MWEGKESWSGAGGQHGNRGPTALPHLPTVSPVPARDRARHRTGKHMMTEVSRGRQAVSLEPGSLPEEPFKALIPPGPHPCPAGTQIWPRPCPCFLGAGQLSPTPRACGRGGRANSCCSAGPQSHWKHSWGLRPDRAGPGVPETLLLETELVRGGGGGAGGSRNGKGGRTIDLQHKTPSTLTPSEAMYPQDPLDPQTPAVGLCFLSPCTPCRQRYQLLSFSNPLKCKPLLSECPDSCTPRFGVQAPKSTLPFIIKS